MTPKQPRGKGDFLGSSQDDLHCVIFLCEFKIFTSLVGCQGRTGATCDLSKHLSRLLRTVDNYFFNANMLPGFCADAFKIKQLPDEVQEELLGRYTIFRFLGNLTLHSD